MQRNSTEAHSILNIGKRYHQPLRAVYHKLMIDDPSADKHLTLALFAKFMGNTLSSYGVFTSKIVFGEHPPLSARSNPKKPSNS